MPDISRLVIQIESTGVLTAAGNMDTFTKSMRLSEQESAKLEKANKEYNESINSMNSLLKSLDQQLIKTKKEQDSLVGSISALVESGGSDVEVQKLVSQYQSLGSEIQNLDTKIKKIQGDKALTGILKDYETGFKSVNIETTLFGESLSTLKQKQDLAKTALMQMVESGIDPAAKEVNALRNQYFELSDQIDKTKKKQQDMAQNFAAFQLIVNKLPGPLKSIASGLMGMVSPATAGVSAFLELGGAVIQFGKDSLQAFGEFELIRSNLELTMGSTKEAKRVFSEVKDFAMKTPFDVAGTAQAVNMLKQAGVATNDLISTLEMLGNVSGGSMERFNRISYNYVQVLQKGILDARDTKEFAGNLVPINKALEAIGVTGKVTADDMVKAFKYMTKEGGMFYNAMYKQADTLVGKTNQMKEAWQNFKAAIAENTGLGQFWKSILDEQTEALQRNAAAINANKEAREARKAIESGEDTTQNRYQQYANELIVLESKIKNLESQAGGRRDAEIIQIDLLYKKRKDILDLLEPYKKIEEERLTREKEVSTELERQKKLIEDQKTAYASIMEGVHSQYASTPQGRIEALRKTIEDNERLLAQGPQRQVPNLFTPLTYGPQLPGENVRTVGITEEDRRKIEIVTNEEKAQLKSLLDSLKKPQLETDQLKAWQIELGKIFDFTPTAGTDGRAAILSYISNLNAESERLAATYGDKTIADMLGISELDQVDAEIADMQSRLREMMEYNGPEPFIKGDKSTEMMVAALSEKQAVRDTLYDEAQYQKYLKDLDREYELLQMTNEEREKELYYDQMKQAGVTNPKYTEELWGKQKRNDYENNYVDLKEELELRLELLGLSEEEARIKELTIQLGDEARAKEIYALEQEIEKTESLINTIKDLKDSINDMMLSATGSGMVDMFSSLGEALREGTNAGEAMGAAFTNMVKDMTSQLSSLLMMAGLKLIVESPGLTGLPAGLALMAASGMAAFISGIIPDAKKKKDDGELDKLQRIHQQITDLIASQREQEEYYTTKRRKIEAQSAISVNDAIITPQGTVYTHPDDYIIATKRPETFGGGSSVNVIINNYADASIDQTETVNSNGVREIMINVKNYMANEIANGGMDGAMDAMNKRRAGVRRS